MESLECLFAPCFTDVLASLVAKDDFPCYHHQFNSGVIKDDHHRTILD